MGYDLLFQQALNFHEQGNLDVAENIYRQILETAPCNPDVLNLLGLIAQQKGLHTQAIDYFYQAIRQIPDHAPYHFNLALSFDNEHKPYEALQAYQKSVQLNPNLKEAFCNMGDIYYHLQNLSQAQAMYRQALKIDTSYLLPQAKLAYMEPNISALLNLWQEHPQATIVAHFLSLRYQQSHQLPKALDFARQADKLSPQNEELLTHMGELLLLNKLPTEAQSVYQKILELNPHSLPALVNVANSASAQQNFALAETYYKQALDISPQDLDAHFNYAEMLQQQNRLPEALEEYRQAVIIAPDRFEISNNLGLIKKDLGEYEEALGLFVNAFLKAPEQEAVSVNIVETLTLLAYQNIETAQKIAANWLKTAPNNLFAQQINATLQGKDCENTQIFVQKLFDNFADNYEQVLGRIGYSTPRELRTITGDIKGTIVDLGCGTGLVGEAYQTSGAKLIGIDISAKILEKAREKHIYQELICDNLLHFCQTRLHTYQPRLIIAADVFCYIDNISAIISACQPYQLAFSIETLPSSKTAPQQRGLSGRYRHNPRYIKNLLLQNGYTNINEYPLILRQEDGKDVQGMIFTAA